MFWEKWKTNNKPQKEMENREQPSKERLRLEQAIEQFRLGKRNYISVIYGAMACKDAYCVNLAAETITGYMESLTSNGLVKLDEEFRQYTSMEWNTDWAKVSATEIGNKVRRREDYLNVLRLGTFHPNGFFREKCLRLLTEDAESLPYLLLRLNDWVRPIREQIISPAEEMISKASAEALICSLPFLEKVGRGSRREHSCYQRIQSAVVKRIRERITELDFGKINKFDFGVKRYLYHLILRNNLIGKERADELLFSERNNQCKEMIIRDILGYYNNSIEELDGYLTNKSAVVRRMALEKKYELLKATWEGLEVMLLDASKSIREMVCYILRKHTDMDIAGFYRSYLESEHRDAAILGLGENGLEGDAELLMPFLEAERERTVCNTIKALGSLMGEKGAEVFWKYLSDDRVSVAKRAYLAVRTNGIQFGAARLYEGFLQARESFQRRYFILLLLEVSSTWKRLPYLLQLFQYEDSNLQRKIHFGICDRCYHAKVTAAEAENIRNIMNRPELQIPDSWKEAIEFDFKYVVH